MSFLPVLLWTDLLVWLLVAAIAGYAILCARRPHLGAPWHRVARSRTAVMAVTVLAAYVAVGLADSLHLRLALPGANRSAASGYSPEVLSLLDVALTPLRAHAEKTYSAPLAMQSFSRELVEQPDGR
ncbi:MAG: ABC transporter permease, partial [Proteobacteria bacterium]|nr:ABC transporter permease [Pseudomonadota bacterium]